MTAWTKDIPEEDGYYFIRWGWWPVTTEEFAHVYTDEDTGTRYIARLNVEDRALPMNPPCEFWPIRLTLQPPTEVQHLAPSGAIPVEHAWVSHRPAGAQPSGAPAKWRVEVVHGRARVIVDASGDSGEQSFWINDADTDDEPGHAEFHARMLRIAIGRILGAPAREAQGEPTLEECLEIAREESFKGTGTKYLMPCEERAIAAVRALFLSRAPSPSPALAAIVGAGDAMAATLRLIRNRAPLHEDYQRDIDRDVAAYDRARAALPKEA